MAFSFRVALIYWLEQYGWAFVCCLLNEFAELFMLSGYVCGASADWCEAPMGY